jgi:hypothetical protein
MRDSMFSAAGRSVGRRIAWLAVLCAAAGALLVPSTALAANGWSPPSPVDPDFGAVSLSCASSSFCVAVDSTQALVYNGASWTSTTIDTTNYVDAVSCTSSTFCEAVDNGGNYLTFNGTTWTTPAHFDATTAFPDAVSCAPGSSTFCVAVDADGNAFTFNGTTWSAADPIDSGDGLDSVSCPTSSFCVAVDTAGNALTYNGTNWSKTDIDGVHPLAAVSCSSASFCAAVDFTGNGLAFGGSTWTPTDIDPGLNVPFAISCASSLCQAIDTNGDVFSYNGSSWTPPVSIDPSARLLTISCPTATACMAVDTGGNVTTYGPPTTSIAPAISGSPVEGATLIEGHAPWTHTPGDYVYQWEDCNAAGAACAAIPGANFPTYVVGAGDVGDTIRIDESAGNNAGTASAVSPQTAVVTAPAATAPADLVAPSLFITAAGHETLGCSGGLWSGTLPETYAYQWLRNGAPIAGATGEFYRVEPADDGHTLACTVTVSNAVGRASATSVAVSVPLAGGIGTASIGHASVSGTTVAVGVSCGGLAGQKCTITLKMTVKETVSAGKVVALSASAHAAATRTVAVGTRTVSLAAGHSETVHVKLDAAGKSLLAAHRKLSVKLAASRRTSVGATVGFASRTIAFKAAA